MELSLAQTEDAYRRQFRTEVRATRPLDEGIAVELEQTIFYPEGGGQPADRGTLDGANVIDVRRDDEGCILHVVEDDGGLPEGEVELELDWGRRFDHMQQHTAQHLITAVAEDALGLETVSFHLGSEYSTIDLAVDSPENSQFEELQARVNSEICRARPVDVRFVAPSTYHTLEVRSETLPDDHAGNVRIVDIDGIDRDACGGTHVQNTAELQAIVLTDVDTTGDRTRLHYLAGGRVLGRLEGCLERESRLNDILSCGPDSHVEAVESALDDARTAERRAADARDELAEVLGERLADTSALVTETHRDETDFDFLHSIAEAVESQHSDQIVLLTASEPGVAREGIFLVSGPEDLIDEVGPEVAEILEGRGGGPPGRYQGKAGDVTRRYEAVERLRRAAD